MLLISYRRSRRDGTVGGAASSERINSVLGSGRLDTLRLAGQGLLGGVLLLCIFVSISLVPLGNASAIFFCTPVFTFAFAVCMLRERLGVYRATISVLMLAGVLLITRPPFVFGADPSPDPTGKQNNFNVFGYAVAVMVPVLSAIVSIITRQLRHLRAGVQIVWFGFGALVVSTGGV